MHTQIKMRVMFVLFLILTLFPVTSALASDERDEQIQQMIAAQVANSNLLQGIQIEVHVQQLLVVLTGEVRLYEQKLTIERIAWTSPGVFEVDNELRIVPVMPLSDEKIKEKIRKIVDADNNFQVSLVNIEVDKGQVTIQGSFLDFRDPSRLKHKVAAIEGVLAIKIDATFLITPVQLNEVAYRSPQLDRSLQLSESLQLNKSRASNSAIKL